MDIYLTKSEEKKCLEFLKIYKKLTKKDKQYIIKTLKLNL